MTTISKKHVEPLLWASLLRLTACALIFIYHFLVLQDQPSYGLGSYGLYIFFFLAGWFAVYGTKAPWTWLKGRLRRILVPYWPVIAVVLIANRIVGYKETTLLKDAMTFAGLSFFVRDPVYVISWFITFLMMLDLSFFVFRVLEKNSLRVVYLVVLLAAAHVWVPLQIRAVELFYIGAGLGYLKKVTDTVFPKNSDLEKRCLSPFFQQVNQALFRVQNYTYSFFLIHGAVLILVIKGLKISGVSALGLALFLSIAFAYAHNRLLRRFS